MSKAALIISLISLLMAAMAYWRAGGKQDIDNLRRETEAVRAEQRQAISAAYDRSRRRLQLAREQLRQLKEQAVESLSRQTDEAGAQLTAIAERLEDGARAAKDTTVALAKSAEEGVARRARHIQARLTLLNAEARATHAIQAAKDKDFPKAEQLLDEAADLLREAAETVRDDDAYDKSLDAMKRSLREATAAVQTQAADVRRRLDDVLVNTNRLINALAIE